MARTRSTKGPTAKEKADAKAEKAKTATATSSSTYTLAPETEDPPRFFILPKAATPEARIVTLQNPRYAKPSRYLACPEAGFFEFNKISPPKNVPRSWLLDSNVRIDGADPESEGDAPRLESQVFDSPDLFIATPIDPLFLLLPALAATTKSSDAKTPKKRMFLASDDHLDTLSELCGGGHLSEVLTWPASRALLEARMAAVSDSVDAGDEQMYRLSEAKLLDEIVAKARRMSDKGLPRSLEDKFVTKALEAPILGIRSQLAAPAKVPLKEGSDSPQPETGDSQSTVSSITTSSSSLSEASTAATSVSGDAAGNETVENAMSTPEDVKKLQRLRIAFNFICASYVAPGLANTLKKMLPETEAVDFKPLDEYMAKLTKLRQEAAAVRTDYSRKRGCDEEADERAEKRRKQEAEDKIKKANQSRGVKSLAKVNTAGMKKMSDFFKKK